MTAFFPRTNADVDFNKWYQITFRLFIIGSFISPHLFQPQLSPRQTCCNEELRKKWSALCLPMEQLESLLTLGNFGSHVDWMPFFALGCSALGGVRCYITHRHFIPLLLNLKTDNAAKDRWRSQISTLF